MTWTQKYTPLGGSLAASTLVAALPVVVLPGLRAFFRAWYPVNLRFMIYDG